MLVVPPAWPPARRAALLDAAAVAGLGTKLALLNSHVAVAFKHAANLRLLKDHDAAEGTSGLPAKVRHLALLFEVGASAAAAAVVEVVATRKPNPKGKEKYKDGADRRETELLKVRGVATEAVGGRDYDAVLAVLLASRYARAASDGATEELLADEPRGRALLLRAAQQAKEQLSAHPVTLARMEGLPQWSAGAPAGHDGVLKVEVTRGEFEDATAELSARLATMVAAALKQGGVSQSGRQLDAAIVVGGGARVPAVQAAWATAVKDVGLEVPPLATGLDGTEAAVLGAALYSIAVRAPAAFPGGREIKLLEDEKSTGFAGAPGEQPVGCPVTSPLEPLRGATRERLTERLDDMRRAASAGERAAQRRSELERVLITLQQNHGDATGERGSALAAAAAWLEAGADESAGGGAAAQLKALQAAFGPDMPPSAAEAEVSARTAAAKEEAEAKKTKKKVAPVSLPHDEVRWLQPWPTPYCRIPATADRRRAAGLGR